MNILVTGANGQLGHEMQIVSKKSKDKYFFSDIADGYVNLDITDIAAVRKMVKENDIHCIVNCAAWTNVDKAETAGGIIGDAEFRGSGKSCEGDEGSWRTSCAYINRLCVWR